MKVSNYELNELVCLHGEMLALLQKYSHLDNTKQWQRVKKQTEKEYNYFVETYEKRTTPKD